MNCVKFYLKNSPYTIKSGKTHSRLEIIHFSLFKLYLCLSLLFKFNSENVFSTEKMEFSVLSHLYKSVFSPNKSTNPQFKLSWK